MVTGGVVGGVVTGGVTGGLLVGGLLVGGLLVGGLLVGGFVPGGPVVGGSVRGPSPPLLPFPLLRFGVGVGVGVGLGGAVGGSRAGTLSSWMRVTRVVPSASMMMPVSAPGLWMIRWPSSSTSCGSALGVAMSGGRCSPVALRTRTLPLPGHGT